MVLYFSIIFFIYYLFVLLLIFGWSRIRRNPVDRTRQEASKFVSVVIAVRNEADNLPKLLSSLEAQTYQKSDFEVIIVNDVSEDETAECVMDYLHKSLLNLRTVSMSPENSRFLFGKKAALSRGIEEAKGDIILVTDGDCWMGEDWIRSMANQLVLDEKRFISGPVVIEPGKSLLSRLQSLEFTSLLGSAASLININYPLMCNGANLAFKKMAFEEVNGYKGFGHYASGDDVFLMQKIHRQNPGSISFNRSQKALVYTGAQKSVTSLISQRRRWASKWHDYLLPLSWIIPVFLFVFYGSMLGLCIFLVFDLESWPLVGGIVVIKMALDWFLLKKVSNFCKLQLGTADFLMAEFLYPIYAVSIGLLVHFGKWTWKGRKHKI